jgi:hypothetical protein
VDEGVLNTVTKSLCQEIILISIIACVDATY